jgi:hypothetical protein
MKQAPSGPLLSTGVASVPAQSIAANTQVWVTVGAASKLGQLAVCSPHTAYAPVGLVLTARVNDNGYVMILVSNITAAPIVVSDPLPVRWMVLPLE